MARYLASAVASIIELFHAGCGVTEFVLTEFEVPNEFVAETENVYLVPVSYTHLTLPTNREV